MSKRFLGIVFMFVFVSICSSLAYAQSNEGALAGTVVDPTGNVVPGAAVTATNSATGQSLAASAVSSLCRSEVHQREYRTVTRGISLNLIVRQSTSFPRNSILNRKLGSARFVR
jgi:hypothetical protein